MTNRRFDVYQYRQILVRMRQGDSDRDIGRSKTMGRKKIAQVRQIAQERGWLDLERVLPDDKTLAETLARKQTLPASCVSTLEPWRELVTQWYAAGVQGTTIHATLKRNHGYTGSYSSMQRFLNQIVLEREPDVPLRLAFKPAEAAQVDFGAGPAITDVYTGEVFKTWFFVMTLAWSRHQYAEFVRDQTVATWLACHRRAFEWFGGGVSRVIIDNAKCAITKACIHDPQVQRAYAECAEGYAFKVTIQQLREDLDRVSMEGALQYVEHAVALLAKRVETGADDAEIFGADDGAKAAGDFLLHFRHAHGTLAHVVGERDSKVADEEQHRIGM
jgi:transposase